ncbi:hypothetical protein CYLTODRAFT_459401 [Cylindrobasidium torrendii FP15055 ss-10]|uniref:Uncharacterized protein n=1 Tax=Cylindrobasidium torrendii FP15055 ss-10 TaxID=1314674 RepID=A0A0D7AVD0_9AGAR|nr:hypothetical protein CYLTODRAFT_459401 [Cylindrobasidium torrendii FP15055 ss-10]
MTSHAEPRPGQNYFCTSYPDLKVGACITLGDILSQDQGKTAQGQELPSYVTPSKRAMPFMESQIASACFQAINVTLTTVRIRIVDNNFILSPKVLLELGLHKRFRDATAGSFFFLTARKPKVLGLLSSTSIWEYRPGTGWRRAREGDYAGTMRIRLRSDHAVTYSTSDGGKLR